MSITSGKGGSWRWSGQVASRTTSWKTTHAAAATAEYRRCTAHCILFASRMLTAQSCWCLAEPTIFCSNGLLRRDHAARYSWFTVRGPDRTMCMMAVWKRAGKEDVGPYVLQQRRVLGDAGLIVNNYVNYLVPVTQRCFMLRPVYSAA